MSETRVLTTAAAPPALLARARKLVDAAFGDSFTDEDWEHSLGGWHAIVTVDGEPVSHAAVVTREIHIGSRRFRSGYVEAVATTPEAQGAGHGARAMAAIDRVIRAEFELGALATGRHRFYERLGWERWRGPTYVIRARGRERTPDEDDAIMVLRFGPSVEVSLTDPIACHERTGDDW